MRPPTTTDGRCNRNRHPDICRNEAKFNGISLSILLSYRRIRLTTMWPDSMELTRT